MMKRIVSFLCLIEEVILWGAVLQMVLLCFLQVVLRYCFSLGFAWGEELLRFEVVLVAFIGAGLCVKNGAHIGVDFVIQLSSPEVKRILASAAHGFTAGFCALLCYLCIAIILQLKDLGFVTPALGIPKYIPYVPLALGSSIVALRSSGELWKLVSEPQTGREGGSEKP
jgi:C4-dicarboxylate transporter DctQ subunit